MSDWLCLTNEVKKLPVMPLLTPSQRDILQLLESLLGFPNWYNLHGPPGTGKTLVGRALATSRGAAYCVLPNAIDQIESGEFGVVIDNVPHAEADVRRLLSRCELRGFATCVLISNQPTELPMRRVFLDLPQPADLAHVRNTLDRLAFPIDQRRLPDMPNLWNVLQACLI